MTIRRTTIAMVLVSVALLAAHIATRAVALSDPQIGETQFALLALFDSNNERSLPTAWSLLLLASIIGTAVAISIAGRSDRRMSRWWLGVAIVFGVMFVDEAASIHELLNLPMHELLGVDQERLFDSGILVFAWTIPGVILVAVVAGLFVPFIRALPRDTRWAAGIGVGVYLLGAVGLELAWGALARTIQAVFAEKASLAFDVLSGIEELFEMLGAVLIWRALAQQLMRHVAVEQFFAAIPRR